MSTTVYAGVHVDADTPIDFIRWTDNTADPRGRYTVKFGSEVTVYLDVEDLLRLAENLAAFVALQRDVWAAEAARCPACDHEQHEDRGCSREVGMSHCLCTPRIASDATLAAEHARLLSGSVTQ